MGEGVRGGMRRWRGGWGRGEEVGEVGVGGEGGRGGVRGGGSGRGGERRWRGRWD